MAAKKKSGPKKASKGKSGCLKQNGKLKKGFKWAKGRKGYCQPVAAAKKKSGGKKKGGGKKKAAAASSSSAPSVKPMSYDEAMRYIDPVGYKSGKYSRKTLAQEGQEMIGSKAMDGLGRLRRR